MTPGQELLFKWALGDPTGWPRLTHDPEVNYEVDRAVSFRKLPPWSEIPEELEQFYLQEVALLKRLGDKRRTLLIFRFF